MRTCKNPDIRSIKRMCVEKIPEQWNYIVNNRRATVDLSVGCAEDGQIKVLINGKECPLEPRLVKLFLGLCIGYVQSNDGWCYKGRLGDPRTTAKYLYLVRKKTNVTIQSSRAVISPGYYRLVCDTVRIDTNVLKDHPDSEVRAMVGGV